MASNTDLQYNYYSNPTALLKLGIVRTATPYSPGPVTFSVANYTYYMRVIEGGSVSAIRLYVVTSSGNICLAIYKNSGSGFTSVPGNQVATTGSIPCPIVGVSDIPLGQTISVVAGDWFSFSADNITVAVTGRGGVGSADPSSPGLFCSQGVNAFPAPAVASNIGVGNNRMYSLVGVP